MPDHNRYAIEDRDLHYAGQFDLLSLQHAERSARFKNQHREVAAALELRWSQACKQQADEYRHAAYMAGENS